MLQSGVPLSASRVEAKGHARSSEGRVAGIPNYTWDDDLDKRLRAAWAIGGAQAALEAICTVRPGWSRDAVQRRARKLGLEPSRRPWSPDEVNLLLHMIGGSGSIRSLSRVLKRTENSVRSKLRQLNYSVDDFDGFRAKDLAERLDISVRRVRYWVERGYLKTRNHRITEESFLTMLRVHSELIPWAELPPSAQAWLRGVGHAGETVSEQVGQRSTRRKTASSDRMSATGAA